MTIPAIFREGHAKACEIDRDLADAYVAHTMIGDPPADAVVDALADASPQQRSQVFEDLIRRRDDKLQDAPQALRDFVSVVDSPEADGVHFDRELALAGSECFYKDADIFLLSLVGIGMMENFSSLISRSFLSTGYTTQQSVRRLRQSTLQVMESMLPYGLDFRSDGRRLTIRARLVHAQARRNLLGTKDWEPETYGVPVSAAHLAYAMATFSARVLHGVDKLGIKTSKRGREGYMHRWRYIGWLVGVPRALLPANEEEALALARVGAICEPEPIVDSIIMAHTMVNSAALTLGIEHDQDEHRKLTAYGYRVSRALIGDELADHLKFPKMHTFGVLAALRWKRRLDMLLGRISPQSRIKAQKGTDPGRMALDRISPQSRAENFMTLLHATEMRKPAFDFELPDHRHA